MFRKHKHRRNPYIEKQKRSGKPVQIKMKLQPSLTIHWVGLLKFTNSQFEGERNIKFTYADMDGALKAMLNTPVRNKSILVFKTKLGVMEILNLADGLDEDACEGIYEQWISYFTCFILALPFVFSRLLDFVFDDFWRAGIGVWCS